MKRGPLKVSIRVSSMRLSVNGRDLLNVGPRRKSRPPKTAYAKRERAFEYMGWVKRQACIATIITPPNRHPHQVRCAGPIEADHAGTRALGRKAPDATCIPLCQQHHVDRTGHGGIFRGIVQQEMRTWCEEAVAHTQALATRMGLTVPSC